MQRRHKIVASAKKLSGFRNHRKKGASKLRLAELILKLQPDTERIIVLGGTAPLDRSYLGRTEEGN